MEHRNSALLRKLSSPHYYWVYLLALAVIGLDQLSKYLIERNLGPYGSAKTFPVGGGLIFKYTKNSGASNNILENASWLLAIVAAIIGAGIVFYYHRTYPKNFWQQASIGLVLGGSLGNLTDRLFKNGCVTDFIHIDWLPLLKNFNLADVAIRIGILIFILTFLTQPQKKPAQKVVPDTDGLASGQ